MTKLRIMNFIDNSTLNKYRCLILNWDKVDGFVELLHHHYQGASFILEYNEYEDMPEKTFMEVYIYSNQLAAFLHKLKNLNRYSYELCIFMN